MAKNIDYIEVGSGSRVKAKWWKRSLTKWQIKVYLTLGGLVIVAAVLLYTQSIVSQLIEREHKSVQFYADILSNFSKTNNIESLFLIENITPTINFPCILTDETNKPLEPYSQFSLNVHIDSTLTEDAQKSELLSLLHQMQSTYPPINVRDSDGKIISRIYYMNSSLVTRLRILPYVEIIIVGVFIAIGYLAFSYLKRNEESNIWVGMAKEAAHQLGTPLSSMLAWMELLKLNRDEVIAFEETIGEMEHDIDRLQSIANRFSLIGSQPKLRTESVSAVIEQVCQYFERRFPHLGKNIIIYRYLDNGIQANINKELFGWVFENLIKNAAEAIEVKDGQIRITMTSDSIVNNQIQIIVSDNGKGMSSKTRKQIFNPGFTTKKRGWGLGLSLSKRIIEDYHKGKIVVKASVIGEGTTFVITIPIHSA